jgi:hypothetical protein
VILPFSRTEFLQVFAAYNTAIWPLQFVAAGLGLFAVTLLLWRPKWADGAIAAVLCTFWLAMAIGYHWTYFSAINDAAYVFGVLFALAALVFLGGRRYPRPNEFRDHPGIPRLARDRACRLLVCGIPTARAARDTCVTHPYPQTPLFGVAPCPTTIFTLGLLLLVRHPRPWVPALIPLLWSVIGGSAAFLLDVPQDVGLIAAAILWVVGSLIRPVRATANQDRACLGKSLLYGGMARGRKSRSFR